MANEVATMKLTTAQQQAFYAVTSKRLNTAVFGPSSSGKHTLMAALHMQLNQSLNHVVLVVCPSRASQCRLQCRFPHMEVHSVSEFLHLPPCPSSGFQRPFVVPLQPLEVPVSHTAVRGLGGGAQGTTLSVIVMDACEIPTAVMIHLYQSLHSACSAEGTGRSDDVPWQLVALGNPARNLERFHHAADRWWIDTPCVLWFDTLVECSQQFPSPCRRYASVVLTDTAHQAAERNEAAVNKLPSAARHQLFIAHMHRNACMLQVKEVVQVLSINVVQLVQQYCTTPFVAPRMQVRVTVATAQFHEGEVLMVERVTPTAPVASLTRDALTKELASVMAAQTAQHETLPMRVEYGSQVLPSVWVRRLHRDGSVDEEEPLVRVPTVVCAFPVAPTVIKQKLAQYNSVEGLDIPLQRLHVAARPQAHTFPCVHVAFMPLVLAWAMPRMELRSASVEQGSTRTSMFPPDGVPIRVTSSHSLPAVDVQQVVGGTVVQLASNPDVKRLRHLVFHSPAGALESHASSDVSAPPCAPCDAEPTSMSEWSVAGSGSTDAQRWYRRWSSDDEGSLPKNVDLR